MNGRDAEPAVSVVLPVRNGAATLARAIASVRAQTLDTWELVLVDDGSTDGTAEIAADAARADGRVRVMRPSAGGEGIVAALNTGIAAARGRWIARLDADDTMHPERLAAQLAWGEGGADGGGGATGDERVGLVSCLVEFGGDRTANAGYALHVDWLNTLTTPAEIALNRFVEAPLAHPSVMFRRELAERLGGYRDGAFPEDYELWLRWLDAGVRMAKVPRVLTTWHDGPGRLSRTDPRYAPEAFFRLKAVWIARELARSGGGRPVWVWGAGRPTRKRAAALEAHGVEIAGYIDVDAKKLGRLGGTGVPVIGPEALPAAGEITVLGYVAARGARELCRAALAARGYAEGREFWMCA
jgi:glycosyltransferase involved in cell wall biosynthesis